MSVTSYIKYVIAITLLLVVELAYAQPANDNCVNATTINFPSGGFGIGITSTANVDLTLATTQFGEPFHSSQIAAGTDKKSVWFKFTLLTARGIKVELKQPGTAISLDAVGFTVFYANACMPTLADIIPAKLTPINKFGSSYNPCLIPGEYYVQVSSKLSANDNIFLEVTTSYPSVLNSHDLTSTAYNFGTVTPSWNQHNYDVGCASIDAATENCPALGANYLDYTQSTWHVFTTDSWVDFVRIEFGEVIQTGNFKVGYNLYQGNAISAPGSLSLVDGCRAFTQTNFNYFVGKNYTCELLPNTTYSIQLFFHKDYVNTIGVRTIELGGAATKAPDPTDLGSAPGTANVLGTLPYNSGAGVTTNGTDWFACNAKIINNVCGTVNPASGTVTNGASTYRLSTWYTFTIATTSKVNIQFPSNYTFLKKFYTGDAQGNCNLVATNTYPESDWQIDFECLAPGTYSLQLLGKIDTSGTNALNNTLNQLGRQANIAINVIKIRPINDFGLTAATLPIAQTKVSSFNGGAALVNGVNYLAVPDTFGCQGTVLPAGANCTNVYGYPADKAIYRKIVVSSSGILTLSGGNYYFRYKLFAGDAQALANAQNVFNAGQTITGLTDYTGCQDLYWSYPKVCVTPGVYTLVSYGSSSGGIYNDIGKHDQPSVRFDIVPTSVFTNPATANNLGDITVPLGLGTVSGTAATWSCDNNPATIDGKPPCYGYQKLIYREFFIATPQYINITTTSGYFRLFSGQVSVVGIGGLTSSITGYTTLDCMSSFNADINACNPKKLPFGWYTVVSYGTGGSYGGSPFINGNIGQSNNISIYLTTPPVIPGPIYNRPFKANIVNGGVPLTWGPNYGTAVVPQKSKTYTFGTERFNCINDLPFPAGFACAASDNRVAYFVFTLTQESYLNIKNIPTSFRSKIFRLNATTSDSTLFTSAVPIQPCISTTSYAYDSPWSRGNWVGEIEICRLQPGTYTLICFGNDSHIGGSLTPVAYVDEVIDSRFDHANLAYDFDNIPGDNVLRYGKVGDVHPTVAGRNPSSDFFTCTTGAQANDPSNFCWDGLYPLGAGSSVPYPMPVDKPAYNGPTTSVPVRRNLWYTFTATGPGRIYVRVNNQTPGTTSYQYPFSIYKSDVNGATAFPAVVSGGQVDSTFTQGLTFVAHNTNYYFGYCVSNNNEIFFDIDPCALSVTTRYYIIVDHEAYLDVNNQTEVGIRFEASPPTPSLYDFYYRANVINGLGETAPPYTPIALGAGTYTAANASIACATRTNITDQNTCGNRTFWYKFESAISGRVRLNMFVSAGAGNIYNDNNIQLYKQIIPGDSTITGMQKVPLNAITFSGAPYGEGCLNLGIYYILVTGCNYTIEFVQPKIMLIEEAGDFCTLPININVGGSTSASGTVTIDCHSIGTDFGEDGSNMGCLFGPANYKSTWFKVSVNSLLKADVSFQLAENTTAFPSQIRYRVLYGSCGALTAGPCNTDALTQFTLNCMPAGPTDYYIQVVSPASATGTLTLTTTITPAPDQNCVPVDVTKPNPSFTTGPACEGQSVNFINSSTTGLEIAYLWNFGHAGATSTFINPSYTYPVTGTTVIYPVRLVVTNTSNGKKDSVDVNVSVYPKPTCNITRDAPQNLPGMVTMGNNVNFHANATNTIVSPPTSYYWDFSEGITSTLSDPINIVYLLPGTKIVTLTVTNGTCTSVCTDTLWVEPEKVFDGGVNDGGVFAVGYGICPSGSIYDGGFMDGAVNEIAYGPCATGSVFDGGFKDGSSFSFAYGICAPGSIYDGGFMDGSVFQILPGPCALGSIFDGGFMDGAVFEILPGPCPSGSIYDGGFMDGAVFQYSPGPCPTGSIFDGGFMDGAVFQFTAGPCPTGSIFDGGFMDGATFNYTTGICVIGSTFDGGFFDGAGFTYSTGVCAIGSTFDGGSLDGNAFTMSVNCSMVLETTLLSFTGRVLGANNELTWTTASEHNTHHFELEKSEDGINFPKLDVIKAAGQSNTKLDYSKLDSKPFSPVTYYRLKMVSNDESFVYSQLVALNRDNSLANYFLYPNPATDELFLDFHQEEKIDISIHLLDALGKTVIQKEVITELKDAVFKMDLSELSTGVYSIKIYDKLEKRFYSVKKVVKI